MVTLTIDFWQLAFALFGTGAFVQRITSDIADLKHRVSALEVDMHEVKARLKA
jgi:hypothetical protein